MSINDLGTGYSSLSYIKWFPIDTMKIYQSFTEKLINYKGDLLIVKDTITMSKTLNLEIIPEVVEHKKHVDFLKKQKCDIIQEFYLSKPLPVSELKKFGNVGTDFD